MRTTVSLLVPLALIGCTGEPAETCFDDEKFPVFADLDGDTFGGEKVGDACALEEGQVDVPGDCDDAVVTINPGVPELCDGLDNNCNGKIDDDDTFQLRPWFYDGDADGYGVQYPSTIACTAPEGWVSNAEDCDDDNPAMNPEAQEVCGGVDEDCDGLRDDADPSVKESTFTQFFRDFDHDGKGDPDNPMGMCSVQFGYSENGDDCDDHDELIGQFKYYADVDLDGFGDPLEVEYACELPPGYVTNNDDCDDTDSTINVNIDWYNDVDGDGFGAGDVADVSCAQPSGMADNDRDCDDDNNLVSPATLEVCGNGFDEDCDTLDLCDTCQKFKTLTPTAADGLYTLDTMSGAQTVYCDMTTDGGGWTLVSSSRTPPFDAGTSFFSSDLLTMSPNFTGGPLWDGMRDEMGKTSDIRFSCQMSGITVVDLSFYKSGWYDEIASKTQDRLVCFEESNGCCNDVPPERRNNLTGDWRERGDEWDYGYLEGEDTCTDGSDFTVDFDDGGMNGDPNDGTDWGMSNGSFRCGTQGVTANFFIWVREK